MISNTALSHGAVMRPGFRELCQLCRDVEQVGLTASPRWIVQTKRDGLRALYLQGRVMTREGGPMACADHCVPGLERLEQAFGCPMLIDGEYEEEDGYCATQAAFRKGQGRGMFWIFDAVPLQEWQTGVSRLPLHRRIQDIAMRAGAADSPFVTLLSSPLLTSSEAAGMALAAWDKGLEGVVAKCPDSLYRRQRNPDWLRLKQTREDVFPIVDMLVREGCLSGILVRTPWGPARLRSGWSAEEGAALHNAWIASPDGRPQLLARLSYQLSSGTKRVLRGVRLLSIKHAGDTM